MVTHRSRRLFLTSAVAAAAVTVAAVVTVVAVTVAVVVDAAAPLVLRSKILVFLSGMQILCVYIFNPSDQISPNLLNSNLMYTNSPAPRYLLIFCN